MSDKYNVSLTPPQGWTQKVDPTLVVQFSGATRSDKTQPALAVIPFDTDAAESMVEAVIATLAAGYLNNRGGYQDAKTLERRKVNVGEFAASQVDVAANNNGVTFKLRFTAVPVKEQNRIYIFAMQDAAKYFDESVAIAETAMNSLKVIGSTAEKPASHAPMNSVPSSLALAKEAGINVDDIPNEGNSSVSLSYLNLFPEQYSGKTLHLVCVIYGGVDKYAGVFALRISYYDTYISPILKRDGITFVASPSIASQLLGAYISGSENCQINLSFRVEKVSDYWIAKVFEVGIHGSGFRMENVITDEPDTSMLIAGKKGDKYSVEALQKRGSNVNAVDIYGKTALMYAAGNGHSGTTKTLLERGADPNIKSKAGLTALAYARQAGKKDIIKLLEKMGAKE